MDTPYRVKRFGDERDWFFKKRFGMFVHWGIYAIPGWHEQHQQRMPVPQKEYLRLRNLPVNNLSNTVLVAKLEFDQPIDKFADTMPE
jgi:hypothetical protein